MIGAYKLTEEDVKEMKHLFNTTQLTNKEIAKLYDVSSQHICRIRNGKRWNDEIRSFTMKYSVRPIVYPQNNMEVIFDITKQRPVPKKKTFFQKTCRSLAMFFLSLS